MARILMVVRPSKGGAFGHVARLGAAMAEAGHEVAVAGPHSAHRDSLPVDFLDVEMGRAIDAREDARAIGRLASLYRSWQPDIIHAHGSKGGVAARLARASAPRVPLVFTPHNYAFTNWFASRNQQRAYRVIETALAPLATRTLCVCEAEGRIASGVGARSRIRVVHNGTNPLAMADPDPELVAFRGGGRLIAAVTEFSPPKGVPTLIEALALLRRDQPGVRLAIAGDGPMRAEITQAIADSGVREAVLLLGQIDSPAALLASADVFVSPGWSESFPYAILEAMSVGASIVATDVGGVAEAVEDGVTGRLVPPRDAHALARALAATLADPAAAKAMGERARERMLERFTFDSMLEGTLAVYRELGVS